MAKRRTSGGIDKLPSKRYRARFNGPDGIRVSMIFKTKADADSWLALQESSMLMGEWINPNAGNMSLSRLAGLWLASNPNKRPSTFGADSADLNLRILKSLGSECKVSTITRASIQKSVNEWNSYLAPRTVKRTVGTLKALLNFAEESDVIGRSPCRGINLPAVKPAVARVLEPDEITGLAKAVGSKYAPMIYLAAMLGLRWSEVIGLRVGRIDFESQTLSVEEAITRDSKGNPVSGPPKSDAGRRTIAIPLVLADILATHLVSNGLSETDGDLLLFGTSGGGYIRYQNWRNRVWLPACNEAGLEGLGFHDLRRTNATFLVSEGVDLKTAQHRLGHSDPRLTLNLYAQVTSKADREAADRIGGHFMPTLETVRSREGHEV